MRPLSFLSLALLLLASLAGCNGYAPAAALSAADPAGIALFGRGLPDMLVSAIQGKDCSVVRLEQGQTYCAPDGPPPDERFCTRTLARVDCWHSPALLPGAAPGVGDTPAANAAQVRYRAAPWPKTLRSE